MSENEPTVPTSADQPAPSTPPAHAASAGTGTTLPPAASSSPAQTSPVADTPGAATSDVAHELPWSPPPRGSRAEKTPELRTRSARRAAGALDVASVSDRVGATSAADGEPDAAGTGAAPDARRPRAADGRRTWVLWVVIGAAVVIVAAVVVTFALLSGEDAKPPTATVTTTLAVPTPTTEPLDRTDATALVQALPGTVRQFVLTSVVPLDGLDGALEAYTVTYAGEALDATGNPVQAPAASASESAAATSTATATDSSTGGAGSEPADAAPFTVTVGQWEDAESATAAAQALAVDLGTPTSTEDVTVAGETTGSLSYFLPDGEREGAALWTNGTVLLRVVGPAAEVVNFATDFGL